MQLIIFRPDGYSIGAHKAEASLDATEAEAYAVWPISFHLPVLPKRLIHTLPNFVVALPETKLRGIFVDGLWEAHVYTNGSAEEENPTKIDDVKRELGASIAAAVKLAVDAYALSKDQEGQSN